MTMPEYTPEQSAAVAAHGKVIVSASAGSGKTFVMIQKLCDLLQCGGDLDGVLAVTFTKKAAAQIKEKLRKTLLSRLPSASADERAVIKAQLNKIPSADISTIHSFCARLVRTYFFELGVDRSFEIVVDESRLADMKNRAADNLFDRLYAEGNADFMLVLECLRRKRSDESVKRGILSAYEKVRNIADYEQKLAQTPALFTPQGFKRVCDDLQGFISQKCASLLAAFNAFYSGLNVPESLSKLNVIADEIRASLTYAGQAELFAPLPPLSVTRRPTVKDDEALAAVCAEFAAYRDKLKRRYDGLKKDIGERDEEYAAFISSGALAAAFSNVLLEFDREYTLVKREEDKLDCADLEHLTLKLLQNGDILKQINARYKYVFVDEYQDVNPVQENILTLVGAHDMFTVGDVKQAIYGFRGSKSVFFSRKFEDMSRTAGALRLSVNFRSSEAVLSFVNRLFGDIMTPSSCGIDYKKSGVMHGGGKYPADCGRAGIVVFGREKQKAPPAEGVYSVQEHRRDGAPHTAEGLAVLKIVERELKGKHYSVEKGGYVDTQPGDICILTRKNAGESTLGIVRALTDAGYGVEGAGDGNLCSRPEIRQLIDILSLIDNCQQDIPLATALLSPLGGFTRDELAAVRLSQANAPRMNFRDCLVNYRLHAADPLAYKISSFFKKLNDYRRLADILGAAALIDKLLADTGLGAAYAAGGGAKLAGVRRLQQEAYSSGGELRLNQFLARLKASGYSVKAPVPSSSESIKVVTMHSSKGLEYPVVIIADIARAFKGNDAEDMPFDDEYGFAPRAYDQKNMLMRSTVLRELCARRAKREDIKNELNLFYVACTRAMCNLYVLCGEIPAYDPAAYYEADCYAKMFNVRNYSPVFMDEQPDFTPADPVAGVAEEMGHAAPSALFGAKYFRPLSVELPVKTSASQIMREYETAESVPSGHLFDDEYSSDGAALPSGREAGTAYHRFLQLCDLSKKDVASVEGEISAMVAKGGLTVGQAALLDAERLCRILSMPAFADLADATVWREREFLCSMPALELYDTTADDMILVQGAIDLLAFGRGGTKILDYKFVRMDEEELRAKYSRQLSLYKKAVARITGVDISTVSASIIDLRRLVQIDI